MKPATPPDGIFVALDTTDIAHAAELARVVASCGCGVKLGLEFFAANGPAGVRDIAAAGAPLFLDLKFHDIPNTAAGAVRAVLPLAPAIITVHASGGPAMLRATAAAAAEAGEARPRVVAVTVLTSLDDDDLDRVGQQTPAADQARRLALLARESGVDGIVCSPHEIAAIRADCGAEFLLVVPGLRPAGSDAGDQKRVMTPAEARTAGAGILVIGRPVTRAADPLAALRAIAATLDRSA